MKKAMKLLMLGLIILGMAFSALNFLAVEGSAGINVDFSVDGEYDGTIQSDGCYGQEKNCKKP